MRVVENAISLDEISKEKFSIAIRKITNLDNPNSVAQMKGWFSNQGVRLNLLEKRMLQS
jgi:DNA polymerase